MQVRFDLVPAERSVLMEGSFRACRGHYYTAHRGKLTCRAPTSGSVTRSVLLIAACTDTWLPDGQFPHAAKGPSLMSSSLSISYQSHFRKSCYTPELINLIPPEGQLRFKAVRLVLLRSRR